MRISIVFCLILLVWVFLAPGCFTFRITDIEAKQQFQKKGIDLTTNKIEIAHHRIHYAQTGNEDSPTIVFIHGTPGSWSAFSKYLGDKELLKKYRIISVDRLGFGHSDFGYAVNLAQQSQILGEWIKKLLNGKPVYLVGHSLGGPMVLKLAADFPDLFSGVVVISGSIDPKEEKPEKWRPFLFKTPLNYFVPGAFRPSNEELWYLKKDLHKLKQDYSKIHIPVYFIHGEKDTWVRPQNVSFGEKMLVNAKQIGVLMFPDGNHLIPWTKYNEIRDVLLNLP